MLQQQMGAGNGTSVWRATDNVLDREVAVKILHPLAAGPESAGLFEQRARQAAGLVHPNLVRVFDSGREGDFPFIVTELLEGTPLDELIAREGPLDPTRAVHVAESMLAAIDYAGQSGVHHGNLDAGRVFIGPGRQVRISDFAMTGGANEANGAEPGTFDDDADTDLVATARILYSCLTARQAPHLEPASPRAIRARVPRDLDTVVVRACAGAHGGGFATASAFRSALMRIHIAPEEASAADETSITSVFRSWMLVPLILVMLAAIVVVGGLALGRLEIGGPLLVEPKPAPADATPVQDRRPPVRNIPIAVSSAWDPFGDSQENDDAAALAVDGSRTTQWRTEDYYSGQLRKAGVGLLIDLGEPRTVTKIRLATTDPGFSFEIRVGNDPDELARTGGKGSDGARFEAARVTREPIEQTPGRYVLVWITSIVTRADGTHGASISDFEVAGPDG